MTKYQLEGKNITVRFGTGDNAFEAVRAVDVCVGSSEAVGIVGESGSGKTTLARVLVGLQRPTIGEVHFEGRRIYSPDSSTRLTPEDRSKIQMIFQDPYSSLNPRMRAWQAVAEAVQVWHKVSAREAKAESLRLLQSMGISADQANRFPRGLSGGQRQRVSVARALAPQPKVLIADEPTSSIDQSAQAQLLNLLRRLQSERGLTIIFISHDLGLVRYLTSRVYVMQKGDVVETGDTRTVFSTPQHPYTDLLISSTPGHLLKVKGKL
jgi:ABC-type dipeptide/oligopeptide/nickel transport system ATPase subunit